MTTPRLLAASLLLCSGGAVFAQGAPGPGIDPGTGSAPVGTASSQSASGTNQIPDPWTAFGGQEGLGIGIGMQKIGGDYWASTTINADFSIGKVGIGLGLPLTLLVWNDPNSGCDRPAGQECQREDKAIAGWIRRPSWNEWTDFFKLVRYVRYGHKRDEYYGLVGQHWSSSIGHGTLLNHYNNALTLDTTKVGLALDVNKTFFGFETFTNNVLNPEVVAGRVYVRPLGDTPFLSGWAIGATYAGDLHAPFAFQMTTNQAGQPAIAVDGNGQPIVSDERVQSAYGLDTEFALLDNELIHLVPYIDWNRIMGAGNGWHFGTYTDLHLPIPIIDVSVFAKLEYRILGQGYIPEYFDQQYENGRNSYFFIDALGVQQAAPKAMAARDVRDLNGGVVQGWYGELATNVGGIVKIGGTLQDYSNQEGGSIGLYATLPSFSLFKAMGYYLRKNFNGLGDAFRIDERSLLGGTLAINVFGPIYLSADFRREWRLSPDGVAFEAVDSYSFGAMSLFKF